MRGRRERGKMKLEGRVGSGDRLMEWNIVVFFFQAEDGIRDYKVTGVQTCALPILQISCDHSWM